MPLRWVYLVVTGNGSYHMYFLLVTLQYALIFPWVLRLLVRTQGRHGLVVLGSLAVQVLTLTIYQWWYLPDDGWRGIVGDASLPAYQFWLVLGAVAGLHLPRWHAWAMRYRGWVLAAFPVAALVLLWSYFAQLPTRGALGASSPLQPVMIVWSAASLGVFYLISVWIMHQGSPWVQSLFSYGAQLSFGVYLVHPMVLDVVLALMRRLGWAAPSVWVSLAALGATATGAVAVCAALHRSRLSLALIGRNRLGAGQAPRLIRVWPPAGSWSRLRARRVTGSALFLVVSVLAVLVIGGDQSPPAESGTPTWEETIEASDPAQPEDIGVDDSFECGNESEAPHSCPLAADIPPG
jgi:peptidoglycan/LPS O-acetylase OafA/YrhL